MYALVATFAVMARGGFTGGGSPVTVTKNFADELRNYMHCNNLFYLLQRRVQGCAWGMMGAKHPNTQISIPNIVTHDDTC